MAIFENLIAITFAFMTGVASIPQRILGSYSSNKKDPRNAVVFVLVGVSLMSISEAMNKYLIEYYNIVQLIWSRYFFFFVPILLILRRNFIKHFCANRIFLQIGRSFLTFAAGFLTVISLKYISLAETTAIVFTYPLLVVVLSAPLLGEHIGRRKLIAVTLGFLGVIIVVQPGGSAAHWAALFPLLAALFAALFNIVTRFLASSEHLATTLLHTGIVGVLITTLPLPAVWQTPRPFELLLMVSSGLCYAIASYLWIRALTISMASTLAPFVYCKMVAATALGYFVFGEVPDFQMIVGAMLIVCSGIYIFHCQRSD